MQILTPNLNLHDLPKAHSSPIHNRDEWSKSVEEHVDQSWTNVVNHLKTGRDNLKYISEFLHQRSALEDYSSKLLSKLLKSIPVTVYSDNEMICDVWTILRRETEKSSKAHLQTAQALQYQADCINQRLLKWRQVRKRHEQNVRTAQYRLRNETRKMVVGDITKNKTSQQFTNRRLNQNCENNATSERQRYIESVSEAIDDFERMECERIELIRDRLWLSVNAISRNAVVDDEGCEQVRMCLEARGSPHQITDSVTNCLKTALLIPPSPPTSSPSSSSAAYSPTSSNNSSTDDVMTSADSLFDSPSSPPHQRWKKERKNSPLMKHNNIPDQVFEKKDEERENFCTKESNEHEQAIKQKIIVNSNCDCQNKQVNSTQNVQDAHNTKLKEYSIQQTPSHDNAFTPPSYYCGGEGVAPTKTSRSMSICCESTLSKTSMPLPRKGMHALATHTNNVQKMQHVSPHFTSQTLQPRKPKRYREGISIAKKDAMVTQVSQKYITGYHHPTTRPSIDATGPNVKLYSPQQQQMNPNPALPEPKNSNPPHRTTQSNIISNHINDPDERFYRKRQAIFNTDGIDNLEYFNLEDEPPTQRE